MTKSEIEPTIEKSNFEYLVFDMDGTLYQLDGQDNGYPQSSLEKQVFSNVINFIVDHEGYTPTEAERFFEEVKSQSLGFSTYFSNRYTISRTEYFNQVWNIDPQGIVRHFETATMVIKQLSERVPHIILLTQAPKVWQQKVTSFLKLQDMFTEVFTGDDFYQKEEIFSLLSQRTSPHKILSIGDQDHSDIQPALKLGMKGLLVKHPEDLLKILELI